MKLGEKIHALRKQAGWNLAELSAKSGVALATLSRMENDKVGSNMKTHLKLCEAFGVALAELYQGVSPGNNEPVAIASSSPEAETFTYDEKTSAILLAKQVLQKHMMPQLLILQPGGKTHVEQHRFGSERWLFVLEGAVEVMVEKQRYPLKRYGTLYFKASLPHQISHTGNTTAKCISVTSPVGL